MRGSWGHTPLDFGSFQEDFNEGCLSIEVDIAALPSKDAFDASSPFFAVMSHAVKWPASPHSPSICLVNWGTEQAGLLQMYRICIQANLKQKTKDIPARLSTTSKLHGSGAPCMATHYLQPALNRIERAGVFIVKGAIVRVILSARLLRRLRPRDLAAGDLEQLCLVGVWQAEGCWVQLTTQAQRCK